MPETHTPLLPTQWQEFHPQYRNNAELPSLLRNPARLGTATLELRIAPPAPALQRTTVCRLGRSGALLRAADAGQHL